MKMMILMVIIYSLVGCSYLKVIMASDAEATCIAAHDFGVFRVVFAGIERQV